MEDEEVGAVEDEEVGAVEDFFASRAAFRASTLAHHFSSLALEPSEVAFRMALEPI